MLAPFVITISATANEKLVRAHTNHHPHWWVLNIDIDREHLLRPPIDRMSDNDHKRTEVINEAFDSMAISLFIFVGRVICVSSCAALTDSNLAISTLEHINKQSDWSRAEACGLLLVWPTVRLLHR